MHHHALKGHENDNVFSYLTMMSFFFFGLIFYFIELCKHDKHARREKEKRTKAQLHDLGNKLSDSERTRERENTRMYISKFSEREEKEISA